MDKSCSTVRLGIFAAGDITDTPSKQIVIYAGEGARAAIQPLNTFRYAMVASSELIGPINRPKL